MFALSVLFISLFECIWVDPQQQIFEEVKIKKELRSIWGSILDFRDREMNGSVAGLPFTFLSFLLYYCPHSIKFTPRLEPLSGIGLQKPVKPSDVSTVAHGRLKELHLSNEQEPQIFWARFSVL